MVKLGIYGIKSYHKTSTYISNNLQLKSNKRARNWAFDQKRMYVDVFYNQNYPNFTLLIFKLINRPKLYYSLVGFILKIGMYFDISFFFSRRECI